MADTKISDLPAVTDVLPTDEYVLARAGTTKKIDASDLLAAATPPPASSVWEVVHDSTLSSDGTFDVSSIAGTYKQLRLNIYGRSAVASAADWLRMRFNNDSGSNYDTRLTHQTGTTTIATDANYADTSIKWLAEWPGTSASASFVGEVEIVIVGYAGTSFYKVCHWTGGAGRSTSDLRNHSGSGLWRNTAAINRIQLSSTGGNLLTGTRLTIYGVN